MCYTYSFSESQLSSTVAMRAVAASDGNTAGADYSSLLGIVSELDCEGGWVREVPLRASVVSIDVKNRLVVVELNPGTPPQVRDITLYTYRRVSNCVHIIGYHSCTRRVCEPTTHPARCE